MKRKAIIAGIMVVAALVLSAGIAVAAGAVDSAGYGCEANDAGEQAVMMAGANGSVGPGQADCPFQDGSEGPYMNRAENGTADCPGQGDCVQGRSCDRLQDGSCDGDCGGNLEQNRSQNQVQNGASNQDRARDGSCGGGYNQYGNGQNAA